MGMMLGVVLEAGEIPEALGGGPSVGKALAHALDDLDVLARRVGVPPLGGFLAHFADQLEDILADEELDEAGFLAALAAIGDDGPWFDPREGARSARGLLTALEGDATAAGRDVLIDCLRCLLTELEYAEDQGTRFHLADSP